VKVIIVIDRLYELDGSSVTIGGIQTYLTALSELVFSHFGTKPTIFQKANQDFKIETRSFLVVGVGGAASIRDVYKRIKNSYSPGSILLIWGSDQHSVRQRLYPSISIQHGIGFDVEAVESRARRTLIRVGLKPFYKFLQRYNARRLVRRSKNIVCVDYNFLNWIRTYGEHDNRSFTVIPNFCDNLDQTLPARQRQSVVIARRFVRRRGIELAVNVARTLLPEFPRLSFIFAGSGPDQWMIESLRDSYPNQVEITRFSPTESLDFHKLHRIALIPSLGSEGTSLSLLEAMSVGCVPVATNVGGMTNIIADGFNGFLVPPNSESIAEALRPLLVDDSLIERVAIAAQETSRYAFSKNRWEDKWKSVLDGVMSNWG